MDPKPHDRPSKAVPRGIAIAIVIGALAGAGWLLLDKLVKAPGEGADAVADAAADAIRKAGAAVKEVLQLEPRVVESTTVRIEGEKATLEVALLETVEMAEYRYMNTWAGSTKVLHVRGRFRVKSGYKLEEGKWFMEKEARRRLCLVPAAAADPVVRAGNVRDCGRRGRLLEQAGQTRARDGAEPVAGRGQESGRQQ